MRTASNQIINNKKLQRLSQLVILILVLQFLLAAVPTTRAFAAAALTFDGTGNYVRVADAASLRIPVNFTLEAWAKPTAIPTGHTHIVGKNNYELAVEPSGGGFIAKFEFSVNGNWREVASGSLNINQWHHIAGSYDGSNMRLFINGTRVASIITSGNIDQTANPLRIGAADASGDFFKGSIDEVRISDNVRYIGNFIIPQAPFTPDSNTRGLWHMSEGSGTTTADASSYNNTGTLVNSPAWSSDSPFTGPDTIPPALSAINSSNLTTSGATINWQTDEPATSQVEYGLTNDYGSTTGFDAALVNNHSQNLSNLTADTTYNYRVISRDASGNQAVSANQSFKTLATPPSTPPVISGMASSNITSSSATITWQTDVPSDSQVEYGLTTGYGNSSPLDGLKVTNHSQTISGLAANTTYHYRVKSRGENGLLATSSDGVFTTSGSGAAAAGQWSSALNWPLVAVHAALLPDGKILLWDAWETNVTTSARLWDPTSQVFIGVSNQFSSIFCSGQAMLADGRQLVVGGFTAADYGIKDTNIFNPATASWTRVADMNAARWYPTTITLSDGQVIALGGEIAPGNYADLPEVYNPANNTWTMWPGARLNVDSYPQAYLMPDGNIFMGSSATNQSRILNVSSQSWSAPISYNPSGSGSSVMYRPGKILSSGGDLTVDKITTVIDLNNASPAWRQTASMAYSRFQHNLVVLPDGKVLAIGGADQYSLAATTGVKPAEMWDPASETWTTMAAMRDLRMYHSVALLLPDGRVLVAGGGRAAPAPDFLTAEIYSPPYLFKGARPAITGAPSNAGYGQTMTVQTPDASQIASVAFVRLSSVTHTLNTDQRYIGLNFSLNGSNLSVTAPDNPNIAPPGSYMLFLVNSSGVPSVASIIQLGGGQTDSQSPQISLTEPANSATVAGQSVKVAATTTDNLGVTSVQFLLNGAPLGPAQTAAPYTINWNTTTVSNGQHSLSAQARDAAGNLGIANTHVVTVANSTTTPPVINSVTASAITASSATIGWLTDKAANSQVRYGLTTSYGSQTNLDPALVTSHSQTLNSLTPSTTYNYQVLSQDNYGNLAVSANFTFTTTAAAPVTLLGNQKIESGKDNNAAGTAEVFQYTAANSGMVNQLRIYIDNTNTASKIVVGLYNNKLDNNPGNLLTQATINNPVKGAWNSVTVPPASVTAGAKYWIAILGPVGAGTVQFRDKNCCGLAQTSLQTNLTILPSTWSKGIVYNTAPMSAYAVQN